MILSRNFIIHFGTDILIWVLSQSHVEMSFLWLNFVFICNSNVSNFNVSVNADWTWVVKSFIFGDVSMYEILSPRIMQFEMTYICIIIFVCFSNLIWKRLDTWLLLINRICWHIAVLERTQYKTRIPYLLNHILPFSFWHVISHLGLWSRGFLLFFILI